VDGTIPPTLEEFGGGGWAVVVIIVKSNPSDIGLGSPPIRGINAPRRRNKCFPDPGIT